MAYNRDKNIDPRDVYTTLIDSGVDPDVAVREAERIKSMQDAAAEIAANTPVYIPGEGLVTPSDAETTGRIAGRK